MIKWIKKQVKEAWHSQWVDHSNVKPRQSWSDVDRAFHLVSPAGHIIFKPKTEKQRIEFRNKYINRFVSIDKDSLDENDKTVFYFYLFNEIIKNNKVRYKANVRTRAKGKWCSSIG